MEGSCPCLCPQRWMAFAGSIFPASGQQRVAPSSIKGISSMHLHRALGISQKAAWFLLHCLRTATEKGKALFSGPVEADETYISGKGKNMSNQQRKELKGSERGPVGQTAVVGLKDHATNKMAAQPVYTLGLKSFKAWGAPT